MTRINQVLFELRQTNSTSEKVELMKVLNRDKIAEEVLLWTLSPFITFGVTTQSFTFYPDSYTIDQAKSEDSQLTTSWDSVKVILHNLKDRVLTGNNAKQAVEQMCNNIYLGGLCRSIINKDLRCGVSLKLVNRAIPGLIPTFVAGTAADIRKGAEPLYPCMAEPKYDGVRVLAMFGPTGDVQLMSRGGREYKNFPYITKALESQLNFKDAILDGEICGDTFDMTMQVAHRGRSKKDTQGVDDKNFVFNVFDVFIDADEFEAGACSYPLHSRRAMLELALNESEYIKLTPSVMVHSTEEMEEMHKRVIALGYEGLILKTVNGKYPFKRSTKAWIKVKTMHDYDGIAVGMYEGKGKFIGTLGGLTVNIGGVITKVGSGFSDDARRVIWNTGLSVEGLGVTIQGQELTKDGCVRFPVFKRFQDQEIWDS